MTAPHQNLLGTSGAVADTEETDPNFNQTVLLLHGDGTNGGQNNTFLDSSSSGHTITRNGNATQGTFNPFLGEGQYSVFFGSGSSNDNLKFANFNGSAFNNDGVFCVELFVTKTILGNTTIFFSSDTNDRIQVFMDTSNNFGFSLTGNSSTTFLVPSGISAGVFNHFCITRDSSNNVRGFINGVLKAYKTNITTSQELTDLHVGSQKGSAHFHRGAISNVRFVAGSMPTDYNTTETATGTTCFTIPSEPLTLTSQGTTGNDVELLCCQSNRFIDNSNNGITPTVSNTPKVTPLSPFAPTASYSESVHGGSAYFDGTGDRLTVVDGASIGTGDFTISAWVYRTSNGTFPIILDTRSADGDTKPVIYTSGANLYYYTGVAGTGAIRITGSSVINNNEWIFVRLVKESNVTKLFVNGTQVGSDYADTNNYSPINDWEIGSRHTNEHYWFGYISNLQVVLSALDGTSVPTAPFTSDENTRLLLNFTNAEIIDSTMKNNGETIADAQLDTSVKKFGTASMEFDGTGDYVRFLNNPFFTFGTGDFTIECFVYFNNTSGTQYICGQSHSDFASGTAFQIYLYLNTIYGWVGSGGNEVSASVFSATTWVHLAFVRQGENIRLYYDGVQQNSTNIGASYSPTVSTGPFSLGTVGNYSSGNLNAFLDEFRVTKGLCRYPDGTSFTAPTKSFANR